MTEGLNTPQWIVMAAGRIFRRNECGEVETAMVTYFHWVVYHKPQGHWEAAELTLVY